MLTRTAKALALCSAILAGSAGAQYADMEAQDVFRTRQARYGHLEYFGFYASAMGAWNFTSELAPFTNLTWIHVNPGPDLETSVARIMDRLGEARDADVQAVVSIRPFLFRNDRGELWPEEDILDFLVELRSTAEEEGLLDTVAMVFPKGEPFRDFKRARNPNFVEEYVTGQVYADIHADLVRANALVKEVFPDTPVGVVLSGNEIFHDFFSIPENYDWVGFDCYSNLFSGCDDRSHVAFYARLLKHMQPHQRLIAVPEAWVRDSRMDEPGWPEVLWSRFRHHYEMALNEPRFVAFVPFLWSFDGGTQGGAGLDRFPEIFAADGNGLVKRIKRIGRQVKNRSWKYPNMDWAATEAHRDRPAQKFDGGILSIDERGLVSAWAVDGSLPHKNLRMRLRVRDADGNVIHRTRMQRSFIRDEGLAERSRWPLIGNHGFSARVPRFIRDSNRGRVLRVEVLTYADGAERTLAHIAREDWTPDG